MDFNPFKKKEVEYPYDEKAEILEPNFPEIPELPSFGEELAPSREAGQTPADFGFRSPDEMRPPSLRPPSVPQFERAETQMPPMRQQPMDSGMFMPLRAVPKTSAPHIYVRVSKYKEVMDSINELSKRIQETKGDMEEIYAIGTQESSKIREAAEVILKIEELLKYLETTFTSPEE